MTQRKKSVKSRVKELARRSVEVSFSVSAFIEGLSGTDGQFEVERRENESFDRFEERVLKIAELLSDPADSVDAEEEDDDGSF